MSNSKIEFFLVLVIPFILVGLTFSSIFLTKKIFLPRYNLLYVVGDNELCVNKAFSIDDERLIVSYESLASAEQAVCESSTRNGMFVYDVEGREKRQISLQEATSLRVRSLEEPPNGLSFLVSKSSSSKGNTANVLMVSDRRWKEDKWPKRIYVWNNQGSLRVLGWIKDK